MIRAIVTPALLLASVTLIASESRGEVIYYTSQSSFDSQGTILSTLNLDSFGPSGGYISGQYGDLLFNNSTYVEGANGSTYAPSRDVAVSTNLQNLVVGIDSSTTHYNMLSVDAGLYYGAATASSPVVFYITTNLNTYGFSVTLSPATGPLTFEGFIADPGEYITSFVGYHNTIEVHPGGVGATDFRLGVTGSAVPEPGSLILVSIAGTLILLGGRLRRRAAHAGKVV
jgi:hypothetical protein